MDSLLVSDNDGDTLKVYWHDDGKPVVRVNGEYVELQTDDAVELYRQLGAYLHEALADSIALEAHAHVYGARQGDYGHPREDFTRTAILWTGLLQHKLADGAFIDAEDIARCMIGVKLSRDVNSPKRDNRVDMAGYAICLDRLETGR